MIKENIEKIKNEIPNNVTLVAVSKTKPIEDIKEAYNSGQRVFGENKVQELTEKFEKNLPEDIEWHFIGHLQRNKVKYIAPFVSLIHAVDSLRLLAEIDKQAARNNRIIKCLLQFHIAEEDTKFGLDLKEANELLGSTEYESLSNIKIVGVMGMGTFTGDMKIVRNEFKFLKTIFDNLKQEHFSNCADFKEISMGMTNDYMVAIEEGSTMVRIGSNIFGTRNYNK